MLVTLVPAGPTSRGGYDRAMAESRTGQFEVVLSDGMRIHRLPLGLAAGLWWMTFVFTDADFRTGRPPRSSGFHGEIPDLIRLDGPAGRITLPPCASGDGGRDGDVYWAQYELVVADLPRLQVTYLDAGAAVASETLDLA